MYIRYVNKLFELHKNANNYTEAGLTLQLYAKMLNWGDQTLPAELRYPSQKECSRKDTLYHEIINCFDNGKVKAVDFILTRNLLNITACRLLNLQNFASITSICERTSYFYACLHNTKIIFAHKI